MPHNDVSFITLTSDNLSWFWSKYRSGSKKYLRIDGVEVLFNIAQSKQYDIRLQPRDIQKRILELLRTNTLGYSYADILEDFLLTPVQSPIVIEG